MSDCELAHSDAAYVLGALSPADRLAFERHLPGCDRCRRSVAELAGMPGLLGRVPREQVEAPPLPFEPLPETVLPALVATVRREQRRKAVLVTLGAAAAVAVVALAATALQAARDDGPTPEAAPTSATSTLAAAMPMDVVIDYGVSADVSLAQGDSGTKVGYVCRYEDDDYSGGGHAYRYNLVVFTRAGETETVASWWARPGKTVADDTTTAVNLDDMTKVELQNDHGKTILRLRL